MLRAHSWAWLLDHSLASNVDQLKAKGFDTVMVLPYFYNSVLHPDNDGGTRYVRTPAKKEGKIIAINRGSNVRVMPYSKDACEYMAIEG